MDKGAESYRRFLDGDKDAFDDIIKELFSNLVFFLDRYVHDPHTSEDIAIDTFSDLIVHRNRYNFKVSLKTYLFMIGRSRALDHIRRRRIISFVSFSDTGEIEDEKAPEDRLMISERKRVVSTAIARLPEDMRAAIHLVYFEDMTYEETAKVMKKSRKQIDNLLYRGKKELRIILGEDGELLL